MLGLIVLLALIVNISAHYGDYDYNNYNNYNNYGYRYKKVFIKKLFLRNKSLNQKPFSF